MCLVVIKFFYRFPNCTKKYKMFIGSLLNVGSQLRDTARAALDTMEELRAKYPGISDIARRFRNNEDASPGPPPQTFPCHVGPLPPPNLPPPGLHVPIGPMNSPQSTPEQSGAASSSGCSTNAQPKRPRDPNCHREKLVPSNEFERQIRLKRDRRNIREEQRKERRRLEKLHGPFQ